MDTILFHNPKAGEEDHAKKALVALLEEAGLKIEVHGTKGQELKKGLKKQRELVLIAGGDGTVGRICRNLTERGRCCAVLPLGTANNLARALGSWPSPEHFAAGWTKAAHRHLNVAMAEAENEEREGFGERRFVESLGFGAFAQAIQDADEAGEEGVDAGRAVFRQTLSEAPVIHARLRIDDQEHVVETLLVEVMNIALFGPNLPLAPDARPGDGLLDVVLLPPQRREAMLEWLHAPGSGAPPVETIRGSQVTLYWPGGAIRVDDEPLEFNGACTITCKVEPAPLTFLVPREALAAPKKGRPE
ncbi:diacylglycerol kinase catalytic domain protein [Acetobacteraceae bacterium AT-5844]|nr:diacylglycerol kinase catalytic domain protein [Acetobacteraceae bacterium AT-5844]